MTDPATEDSSDTLKQFINNVLDKHSEHLSIAFTQNTLSEVNGTYTAELIWIIRGGILPSQIPELEANTIPLTEEEEYVIQPNFKITTQHIDIFLDFEEGQADHVRHRIDGYNGRVDNTKFDMMKQLFSEIHLDETELTEFVEQGEGYDQLVEFVEISSYSAESQHLPHLVADATMGNGNKTKQAPDDGIHIYIQIRYNRHSTRNGIWTKKRFEHIQTLTIDGQQYPVNIETGLTMSGNGGRGQWIHTGYTLVEHGDFPKITLNEELNKTDWSEFLANGKPWPEAPGIPNSRE